MRKVLLYLMAILILIAFFFDIFLFIRFNISLKERKRISEACQALSSISVASSRIFSGADVSQSITVIKDEKRKFENFISSSVKGEIGLSPSHLQSILSLWEETAQNLNFLIKNIRDSKEFFTAYYEINNSIKPINEALTQKEKSLERKIKSQSLILGTLNFLIILSLPLFLLFWQKTTLSKIHKNKEKLKSLFLKLEKDVDEISDEIEEISTKTIKLSLRKSEDGFSSISSSLEEMRDKIDSFLRASFLKEGEDFKGDFRKLVEDLSLSLNSITTSTIVEMEKFKDMGKNLEKMSGKLSSLKKKVSELYVSIKNTEKEI